MTIKNYGYIPLNVANGIREFSVANPNKIAIIDGNRTVTYIELNTRSSQLANFFILKNYKKGDRVAVISGNRMEYPEIVAGLSKAGLIAVLINPRSVSREVEYFLNHSESKGLIIENSLLSLVEDCISNTQVKDILNMDGKEFGLNYEAILNNQPKHDPFVYVDEKEPFKICYTSGTTGQPKGITISHRSRCLVFMATALEWGLGPSKSTIAVAPMYHGAGFAFNYAALYTGGQLIIQRKFDPLHLLELIKEHKPNSIFLVPAHAIQLRELGEKTINKFDTTSLSCLYFNAAPLPQELKLWVLDRFPTAGLHELYGATETAIVTCLRPEFQREKERCVGPPWFFNQVELLNEAGEEVLPGEQGELFAKSPYLMNGYWNDKNNTLKNTNERGFFTVGDMAVKDEDGFYYIVDRKKDMIISGATNISPREIEEVLLEIQGIIDVAVVGVKSEKWGEAVTAVMVKNVDNIDLDKIENYCRKNLSSYKIPKSFHFVESLPRNAAGKILKRVIKEQLDNNQLKVL
jgi:acyl-CoA synthetase (AMP-forming)/AMP-acid ligase II